MEKPVTRISVRNLVEFILRSGDLDSRRGTMDKEAMLKGSRLHRKLQKQMGGDYRAEVALKRESSYEDLSIQVEGRADGIFTEEETTWIDEIKGIYGNVEKLEQPVAVHKAQAMCYGYIVAMEENLSSIGIQMTYANLDTEEIKRFREVFSIEDLSDWYQKLLDEYHKWLSYSLKWKKERNESCRIWNFRSRTGKASGKWWEASTIPSALAGRSSSRLLQALEKLCPLFSRLSALWAREKGRPFFTLLPRPLPELWRRRLMRFFRKKA